MFGDNLERIVAAIEKNYDADEIFFTKPGRRFPSRKAIKGMLNNIRRVIFPGYFGEEMLTPQTSPQYFIGQTLIEIEQVLREQIILALEYTDESRENYKVGQCKACAPEHIVKRAAEVCTVFFDELPNIQRVLLTDVQAIYDGDPAAESKEEVIFSYPGLYAIYVYRLAHVLYEQKVPIIPRIMTELAHSGTGIDIGAGAQIGEYFFIDHGTGVVIGETTIIGNNVKIYQGVTLGALSTRGGQRLSGVKRHPTIEDDVTIYSNASVLGGQTVVGRGSVIAGSTFVTESVPPNSRVSAGEQKTTIRTPDSRD
jgi:serine O-acetyltransferase